MRSLIYITLFALLSMGVVSCGGPEEIKQEVIRPVKYLKISPGGGSQTRTFTGTAVSGTEARLSFKVAGTINSLRVKTGEDVPRGYMLATLDDADYQIEYERSDAAVKNADASEKQAKSNYERVRSLYENNSTSLSELENAKAVYESAQANESSLKKARKLAKAQLEYTRITAPISGRVSNIDVEVNENVNVGQPILTLHAEGDLEVNLGVPESFIGLVKVKDKVELKFSSLPNETFIGEVSEVSYSISNLTSTYPVVVKMEDKSGRVRPGMAATVRFTTENVHPEGILLVPAQAVGEDENGNFVYCLKPDGDHYRVSRQAVTVGSLTRDGFEIVDGLKEGELIATVGLQMLLEGMKVKLFESDS